MKTDEGPSRRFPNCEIEYERKFMNPILFFIISMLRPLRSGAS